MMQAGKEYFGTVDQIINHIKTVGVCVHTLIDKLEETKKQGYDIFNDSAKNRYQIAYEVADDFSWDKFEKDLKISFKQWLKEKLKEDQDSANFNINQQPHGGQSVSQPAPNPQERTSPC